MKKDFRAQENRTTIYVTFRIFLNELFHFTKYVLRLIIKRKRFKRNVEFVRLIYEDRRADQLKNYELTTLDDYIYGSPTALEETKRWNLYNGKLRFGYHKQIQEKKHSLIEEKLRSINTNYIVELGSGGGSNILNLARKFPKKEFIGIELSKYSVELSNKVAKKFGITNAKFYERDLTQTSTYSNKINRDSLVFTVHCFEEMPRIFKTPLKLLKEKGVKNIFLQEPAYIFNPKRHLLDVSRLMRIIYHDRLWGLIKFCKNNFLNEYKIKAIDLGFGLNPVNPSSILDISLIDSNQ